MKVYAAGLCAVVIAGTALAVPACPGADQEAACLHHHARGSGETARARRPVAPRSFLDAGTEVRPGDRKFTDYAFPASGNAGLGINAVTNTGGKVGWDRSPMMQPFQLPGYNPW